MAYYRNDDHRDSISTILRCGLKGCIASLVLYFIGAALYCFKCACAPSPIVIDLSRLGIGLPPPKPKPWAFAELFKILDSFHLWRWETFWRIFFFGLICGAVIGLVAVLAEAKRKRDQNAAEAARLAKLAAERKEKREEEDRQAQLEADRKAKLEADRKAKLEADRQAKLEADRLAKEQAHKKHLADSLKSKVLGKSDEFQKIREYVDSPLDTASPVASELMGGIMRELTSNAELQRAVAQAVDKLTDLPLPSARSVRCCCPLKAQDVIAQSDHDQWHDYYDSEQKAGTVGGRYNI